MEPVAKLSHENQILDQNKIYTDGIRFNVRLNHIALIFVGGMFLGLSPKKSQPVRKFRI